MDGAIVLGSIKMQIVQNEDCKRAFMAIMKDAVGDSLKEKFGPVAMWDETPAPESERSGHA